MDREMRVLSLISSSDLIFWPGICLRAASTYKSGLDVSGDNGVDGDASLAKVEDTTLRSTNQKIHGQRYRASTVFLLPGRRA